MSSVFSGFEDSDSQRYSSCAIRVLRCVSSLEADAQAVVWAELSSNWCDSLREEITAAWEWRREFMRVLCWDSSAVSVLLVDSR